MSFTAGVWMKIFTDVASNFNCEESFRHLTTFGRISGPVQLNIKKRYRRYSYIPTKRLKSSNVRLKSSTTKKLKCCQILRPIEEIIEEFGADEDKEYLLHMLGEIEKVCPVLISYTTSFPLWI